MEYILLLAIIGILIYNKVSFNERFDDLEERIKNLNKSLEGFKKTDSLTEKEVYKSVAETIPKPIVEIPKIVPIPTIKPYENEVITPFPALGQVENEQEKVVFDMNKNIEKPIYSNPKPYVKEKSWWESFKDNNPDLEKFIGENLINKLGILILVLGISYFVKYSIDKGWINEPARVGIGVLSGALVMGVAHKLRQKFAAFSSVFVAGAIAIFYFTISIAFHDYHLINQTVAFSIMVIITAFSCAISLSYDRMELAILSLIGGFAVPFMVSSGEGNFMVLFAYIAILDIGIMVISYFKKWNLVKILAYIFTILLFGGWLFKDLNLPKPHYLSALIFSLIFYFIFNLTNIANNLRTKEAFTSTELSLLVSNSFLLYAAGMLILKDYHPEYRGLFTTFLGFLNFVSAYILYKKFGLDKVAVYLLIGLTLTFITLAIPIQFEGNQITLFWAAEAVLLMWLSQKSGIISFRFASAILSFLMFVSLIMDWNDIYNQSEILPILINKICLTGIFAAASLCAIYYLLRNETEEYQQFGISFDSVNYRKTIRIILVILSYFVGIFEVIYQSDRLVYETNSAIFFPILYHLLFSLALFLLLFKSNDESKIKIATFIGLANFVLFCFCFINFAFNEHQQYIISGIDQRIGLYLHYLCLIIVLFFVYKIYISNKKQTIFSVFKENKFLWAVCFFVIYLTSKELILNSLVISNSPVTMVEIQKSGYDKSFANEIIANNNIDKIKTQIIKTGYPILWGILAFIFLIIGIKKQLKTLRIIALTLLGLTIVKLFLYDISNASETGKIIAFILLGVLILIISFVYQKIKVLVLDDNKTNEINENQ